MFKMLSILLFISVVDVYVQCSEPSLLILRNINGIEEPAPSVLVTRSGKDISLICKTVGIENQKHFDNPVVWSKITNRYKFQNKNEKWTKNKIFNRTGSSKLSFMPVNINDQGIYCCTNIKSNVSINLYLIVQPYKSKTKTRGESRWKRAEHDYGQGYPWGMRTPEPELPRINSPDPIRDFLDYHQKKNKVQFGSGSLLYDPTSHFGSKYGTPKPDVPQINIADPIRDFLDYHEKNHPHGASDSRIYGPWSIDTSNFGSDNVPAQYPSWQDTSHKNTYWKPGQSTDDFEKEHHFNKSQTSENNNTMYYFWAAFSTILVIGVLIYIIHVFISHRKGSRTIEVPNNTIPLPWPYTNPPANGTVETVNSSNRTPTSVIIHGDESDEGTRILTTLISPANATTDRDSIQPAHLDIPPSYDNSTRDSGYRSKDKPSAPMISSCDLPPSYDEALANFTMPAPSYSPSAPSYSPSAPLALSYSSASVPSDVTRGSSQNVRRAPHISVDDL